MTNMWRRSPEFFETIDEFLTPEPLTKRDLSYPLGWAQIAGSSDDRWGAGNGEARSAIVAARHLHEAEDWESRREARLLREGAAAKKREAIDDALARHEESRLRAVLSSWVDWYEGQRWWEKHEQELEVERWHTHRNRAAYDIVCGLGVRSEAFQMCHVQQWSDLHPHLGDGAPRCAECYRRRLFLQGAAGAVVPDSWRPFWEVGATV